MPENAKGMEFRHDIFQGENLLTQILIINAFCYEPTSPLGVPVYAFG